MSSRKDRHIENLTRTNVRINEVAQVAVEENERLRKENADLRAKSAPVTPTPVAPPAPPSILQQFRALSDPTQRALFVMQNEAALLADLDAERRGG